MRHIFRAATTAFLAAPLLAGSAFAADLIIDEPAVAAAPSVSGIYVELYGGGHFPMTISFPDDFEMSAGGALGASIGLSSPIPGLSFELDAMWTSSEYTDSPGYFNDTVSLMVNAEYAVPVTDTIDVYGLVGVGAIQYTYIEPGDIRYSASGAGYQVGIGGRFEVVENVSVFSELKYQTTFDDVVFDAFPVEPLRQSTLNAVVGLRFEF